MEPPSSLSSAQLEQQFQARIVQAKEAARLASIAAAARGRPAPKSMHTPITQPETARAWPASLPLDHVPLDVQTRIDRLVDFVARNGDAFEATAMHRERDNPDFAFLRPDGPFAAYYQWKKQQRCRGPARPPSDAAGGDGNSSTWLSTTGSRTSSTAAAPVRVATDPLGEMSVGAMANVCKYARASGVHTYAPIPRDVVARVDDLPPVEPARLEIRLAEFYRHEKRRSQRD